MRIHYKAAADSSHKDEPRINPTLVAQPPQSGQESVEPVSERKLSGLMSPNSHYHFEASPIPHASNTSSHSKKAF